MQKFVLLILSIATSTGFASWHFTPVEDYEKRLESLHSQVEKELNLLDYPKRNWTISKKYTDGTPIHDVVIIGGGQSGLTLAFALKKEKITNVVIFDENSEGQEGPWLTYGRMDTLRSPKYVIGPDCNVPSLTCQTWFEAKYGMDAWGTFKNVPRKIWAEYLQWFRRTLNLPVVNNTKVGAFTWNQDQHCFVIPIETKGEEKVVYARKIILATGFQGSGEWIVPDEVKNNLPPTHYTSVYKEVDFEGLRGKKVAILGAGPCAFDAVTQCYHHGAEEIHLFVRREKLPNLHAFRWGEYGGFLNHFPDLSDEDKWKYIAKIYEMGQPPTPDGFHFVRSLPNVKMHFGSPWLHTAPQGDKALVNTPQGTFEFDHLLTATGWTSNLKLRTELQAIEEHIALWSDRFTPPAHQHYEYLLTMPYLGKYFELTEKTPGSAPYLNSIYNCTGAALLSEGLNLGTGLLGVKYSTPKIVYGIISSLFLEDKEDHFQSLENYNDILFSIDE